METNHTIETLKNLSNVFSLDGFYCITLWKQSNQIHLQGKIYPDNLSVASGLDIPLVFDPESMMLNGETADRSISMTLTS